MLYRNRILAIIFVSALPFQGTAQNTTSPQKSTDITGNELVRLLHGSSANYAQASNYIGNIYAKHFNNGVVPDQFTLKALTEIVDDYMFSPGRKWDVPAEGLVIEALNPALLQKIRGIPLQIEAQKVYWANAYKAAEAYFAQPSSSNAKKLSLALPDKEIPILDNDGERRLHDLVFDFFGPAQRPFVHTPPPNPRKNFSTIERGMKQGDAHAVEIMFRLINISDGATTETICFALGELIPEHPRLFLQKLLAHEANLDEDMAGSIVGMVTELGWIPEAGNDQAKYKQIYNERIKGRIKALKSVDDPDLREIRDRCLARLKKEELLWP